MQYSKQGDSPDEEEEEKTTCILQDNKADGGVGTGNEYVNHHMVQFPKCPIDFFGEIERVIDSAGRIQQKHTDNKNADREQVNRRFCLCSTEKQWEGGSENQYDTNKMRDGTAGVFWMCNVVAKNLF